MVSPVSTSTAAACGARAVARCDHLGAEPYTDGPEGLFRAYLSSAHREAVATVAQWMREAGMATRVDPAGNLIGRYEGERGDQPMLLIGSHLDSVRDAGRYDGPLGVMLGLECVAALHSQGRRMPFAIEVIAFGDEEGSRFGASMLCSRAAAGALTSEPLGLSDKDGVSLAQAMQAFGLSASRMADAAYEAGSVRAYLEAHIEQGPVLEAEDLPVGIVTGIAAQRRLEVVVDGRAGHAGTTAMTLRRDALTAAAECILAVERIALDGASDLVATVGRLVVAPGAVNVVPGRATFSIDVRAPSSAERDQAAAVIQSAFADIARQRGVAIDIQDVQELPASPCDPSLIALLNQAIIEENVRPRLLMSGAGHDAMVMQALCPTAMVFIRCAGGISHNPAEHVDAADADVALRVMLRFIERLGDAVGT
jgi:allantoate deiminase